MKKTYCNKYMKTGGKNLWNWVIVSVSGVIGFLFVSIFFVNTIFLQNAFVILDLSQRVPFSVKNEVLVEKPEKVYAKGLYLTAYSAASKKKRESIIALIENTELNTVVIDIKDDSGYVLYDSNILEVDEAGLEDNRLGDVAGIIKEFHDRGIYVIARQMVFQDPALAKKRPQWAIRNTQGGLWKDHKGQAWVDPTKKEVWEYNMAIAKEAVTFGFDEVNFDYVRFPSDGDMRSVVYTNKDKKKHEVMEEFYRYLGESFVNIPAWVSIDMFGFVMERHDGMVIGQRLADAVDVVDYICPMMYPSHYPRGHLGLRNPAAHPGEVIRHGMEKGVSHFAQTKAAVRPWIQAFNIGAMYGEKNIRAQIDEIERFGGAGWLLWNAANRYSSAGLKMNPQT